MSFDQVLDSSMALGRRLSPVLALGRNRGDSSLSFSLQGLGGGGGEQKQVGQLLPNSSRAGPTFGLLFANSDQSRPVRRIVGQTPPSS